MDEVVVIQKNGLTKFETAIWAAKLLLLCVGFISTLVFFKVEILPYTSNLILSTFHPLSISLRSWLSPPYIYIILNFIIITIAASTRTRNYHSQNIDTLNNGRPWHEHHIKEEEKEEESNPSFSLDEYDKFIDDTSKKVSDKNKPAITTTGEGEGEEEKEEEEEEALHTIEDTWRLITEREGTRKPELKKSDTWDTPPRPATRVMAVDWEEEEECDSNNDDPVVWARRELRKSDTFNDRVTFIKREMQKSMTQDELTQRVEAFIHKFNKDMRLQRDESQQLFMEIMNRGV